MKLGDIAHSRAGDKGNISNLSLIPYNELDYLFLKKQITEEKVKSYFNERIKGSVTRYELPHLHAFNFVLEAALYSGVTRSLALDPHGKTLSSIFLMMEIDPEEYRKYRHLSLSKTSDNH
ncbi:MAG: hypothetical protein HWD84_10735 [Flavobacteriaceae bacterium]|jgi:hypothetical protein|nr:hypothetical protein [Flavobacteriaceae bacterium]NVJ71652.1 hypothetical protein [Flavobacteriaceae bacterium]